MGQSGSPARRRFPWVPRRGRGAQGTSAGVDPDGRAPTRRLRARTVTRDFSLWEAELAAETTTLTTVIGSDVVDLDVGRRPIEETAAHLRRLRAVIDAMPPDVSFVRWEGVIRAYDDYLWTACRDLGVPTDLVTIGFGRQRDEERCRLERLLHEAGLPVR